MSMPEVGVAVWGARGSHDDVTTVTEGRVMAGVDAEREEPVDDEEDRDGRDA